jgi:hypothetical protein
MQTWALTPKGFNSLYKRKPYTALFTKINLNPAPHDRRAVRLMRTERSGAKGDGTGAPIVPESLLTIN